MGAWAACIAGTFLLLAQKTRMHTPIFTRREFMTSAAVGAALAATGALPAPAGAESSVVAHDPSADQQKWDDSWTRRLGKYRTVFDISELDERPGLYGVLAVMDAYYDALGATDAELGFVVVMRHDALPMLVSDAMWDKYDVGANEMKRKQPDGKQFRTNPFRSMIEDVQKRGVTILGCDKAMTAHARTFAQRKRAGVDAIRAEIQASILPGVVMLPNGLYALARAQNVGCGLMA